MAKPNIEVSAAKYERFINDVLREDLRRLELRLKQINAEISDLIQQRHALKLLLDKTVHPTGFKAQVNLGCNFFMKGSVTDTSTMLINLGLDHYLECSPDEANRCLDARIKDFEKLSVELRKKAAEIKAHIKLMIFSVGELYNQDNKT